VRRGEAAHDRRIKTAAMTPAGRRIIEAINDGRRRILEEAFTGWSATERPCTLDSLVYGQHLAMIERRVHETTTNEALLPTASSPWLPQASTTLGWFGSLDRM
jgi:DNA-binding MarR family transcriptional regulator